MNVKRRRFLPDFYRGSGAAPAAFGIAQKPVGRRGAVAAQTVTPASRRWTRFCRTALLRGAIRDRKEAGFGRSRATSPRTRRRRSQERATTAQDHSFMTRSLARSVASGDPEVVAKCVAGRRRRSRSEAVGATRSAGARRVRCEDLLPRRGPLAARDPRRLLPLAREKDISASRSVEHSFSVPRVRALRREFEPPGSSYFDVGTSNQRFPRRFACLPRSCLHLKDLRPPEIQRTIHEPRRRGIDWPNAGALAKSPTRLHDAGISRRPVLLKDVSARVDRFIAGEASDRQAAPQPRNSSLKSPRGSSSSIRRSPPVPEYDAYESARAVHGIAAMFGPEHVASFRPAMARNRA